MKLWNKVTPLDYKSQAIKDLEQSINNLQTKQPVTEQDVIAIRNNLDFAVRLKLITEDQRRHYLELTVKQLEKRLEYQKFHKENTEIVDDLENPLERSKRYQTMDSVQAKIAEMKAQKNASIKIEKSSNYKSLER